MRRCLLITSRAACVLTSSRSTSTRRAPQNILISISQGEGGNRIGEGFSYLRLTDLAARRYSQELRGPRIALAPLPLVDLVERMDETCGLAASTTSCRKEPSNLPSLQEEDGVGSTR